MSSKRTASCFCGAVQIELDGEPVVQGYCHCTSCRAWTAQPFMAYSLWPTPSVTVTQGAALLGAAKRNENITNRFCTRCGGNVMSESSQAGLTDVFPAIIKEFEFEPGAHVNYGERMIDMQDGLPKFRDMPKQSGGSGELIAE